MFTMVAQVLRTSLSLLLILTIVTGLLYPAGVTLIAQVCFSHAANGSLIMSGEEVIGSELIGQTFSDPAYFWGRLSATSPTPYNAAASSGSNLGPSHVGRAAAAEPRIRALRESGMVTGPIPIDLVTASASGLDPHISPEAAEIQIGRVARARGMTMESVRELVAKHTIGRQFGVLGAPRVNVLRLNLALDDQAKGRR